MKTIYKWSSRVFLVIFVAVLIPVVNLILTLTEKIGREVKICNQTALSRIDGDFISLYIGLSVLILSSLLAILCMLLYNRNNVEGQSIVYIDRDQNLESSTNQNSRHSEVSENISQNINLETRLTIFKNELMLEHADQHLSEQCLEKGFNLLCKSTDALQGALFVLDSKVDEPVLEMKYTFAYFTIDTQPVVYNLGDGLVGQSAKQKQTLLINHVPDGHIKIISGLGSASPSFLLLQPLICKENQELKGVAEIAFFATPNTDNLAFIHACAQFLADHI